MDTANAEFLPKSRVAAGKGLWPHAHIISRGTVLYRFVDLKRSPPSVAADGPWWFEYEHFQTIKHFALQHNYSLGYSARLFAAILYEWSEVNAVARARVDVPLAVWKGRGKQIVVGADRPLLIPELDARDKNRLPRGLIAEKSPPSVSKMTPMQGPKEVYQLYVPGLGGQDRKFKDYFTLLSMESIATG